MNQRRRFSHFFSLSSTGFERKLALTYICTLTCTKINTGSSFLFIKLFFKCFWCKYFVAINLWSACSEQFSFSTFLTFFSWDGDSWILFVCMIQLAHTVCNKIFLRTEPKVLYDYLRPGSFEENGLNPTSFFKIQSNQTGRNRIELSKLIFENQPFSAPVNTICLSVP